VAVARADGIYFLNKPINDRQLRALDCGQQDREMIIVNAIVRSHRDDIRALITTLAAMEAASRRESGCRDYTFSVELNDPDVLRITSKWDTLEQLQAHFRTKHMADFQRAVAQFPPSSTEVKCYEVREIAFPER
jgi:quinol monooxygenase YgiN